MPSKVGVLLQSVPSSRAAPVLALSSRLWLKCFWSLKLHIRAKLRMRTFWLNRRKERDEMLLEMFNFWMDAEKKRSAQVRKAMQVCVLCVRMRVCVCV